MQKWRNLSIKERLKSIAIDFKLSGEQEMLIQKVHPDTELAQSLIENAIGYMSLPLGLATHFVIDGKPKIIPMCVEETSIIAAASSAAKWISQNNGSVTTEINGRQIIAQIHIPRCEDPVRVKEQIDTSKDTIISNANNTVPGLVSRGGGFQDLRLRVLNRPDSQGKMAVLDLFCDPCDAMGANLVTQAAEALRPLLKDIVQEEIGIAILSNLNDRKCATATVEVPLEAEEGERIEEASFFAEADVYRAATHNKGIMNAVDAILIATGNDWRAVEAGAHSFAAKDGAYRPLAFWRYSRERKVLVGKLTMPVAVAIVGGMTKVHPTAQASLQILQVESSLELGRICVAAGLVQNLAALRALTGPGLIQGHMKLHTSNIAYSAGARPHEFLALEKLLQKHLKERGRVTQTDASRFLSQMREKEDISFLRGQVQMTSGESQQVVSAEHP